LRRKRRWQVLDLLCREALELFMRRTGHATSLHGRGYLPESGLNPFGASERERGSQDRWGSGEQSEAMDQAHALLENLQASKRPDDD
jgi:hypothetical protein